MAGDVIISDHALLRFIERYWDFPVESIREQLKTATLKKGVELGASAIISHGGRLIIQGDTVVTFIPGRKMDQRNRRGK